MATRTSVGSGRWSDAATWDTGVPADGDTAVIAAGHTVIFDADQSAFATGVILTINGTLQAATDLRVSGDDNATIAANAITGLTRAVMTASDSLGQAADTSVRSIFASVVDDGGGHWHIDIYKETGRTTLIAHTGDITADGDYALTADGGSGVGGTLTVANWATIAADTDIELSGYYYWKNGAGDVTFGASGVWAVGSSGTAYPQHCKFVANLNGAREITMSDRTGCVLWYCSEPSTRYVKLSGAEAAGQTELSVDTDVTGESSCWFVGAEVRIDDADTSDSELRTISGVAAGAITVSAGLTNAKITGAYVILITRNVRVIGHTGTGRCFYHGTGSVLGAEIRPASGGDGVYSGSGHTISGIVSGCTYGVYYAGLTFVGATLATNITNVVASGVNQGQVHLVRAYDYGGAAGDTRSWSAGGYGATDTSIPAPGFADSFKLTMTDASFWNYHQDGIMAYKDRPLIISVACKNGAAGLTGRARVELIEGPAEDPFLGGTPTKQYIAPDDTDWHIDRWFVMPTANTTYTIRGSAKHGSENAWVAWRVESVPQESV